MDDFDSVDLAILRELQVSGRMSNAKLAERVHLSPPAVHARLRRLENQGVIRGYVAILDRERAGFEMLCFVHLLLERHQPEQVREVTNAVRRMPEVLECHHVTGEYDYVLKVVVRNRADLQRFILEQLTPVQGIARVHTGIVLSEVKSTTALPMEAPGGADGEEAE